MKSLKTNLKIVFAAALGIVAMSSCSELTLSENEIHVNGLDTVVSLQIDSKVPWTAEISDSTWIEISQSAGSGNALMLISAKINQDLSKNRESSITIKTAKNFYVINIFQSPIKFNENGDLGLSVKWCEKNWQATSSIDDGKRVTGVKNISESHFRQPTKKEFQELFDNCKIYHVKKDTKNAVLFLAKNGNGIIFPLPDNGYSRYGNDYIYGQYFYNYSRETQVVKIEYNPYDGVQTYFSNFWQGSYLGMYPEVELLRMVSDYSLDDSNETVENK